MAKRKIYEDSAGPKTVKVYWDPEYKEYEYFLYINGVDQGSGFADDKKDAIMSAQHLLKGGVRGSGGMQNNPADEYTVVFLPRGAPDSALEQKSITSVMGAISYALQCHMEDSLGVVSIDKNGAEFLDFPTHSRNSNCALCNLVRNWQHDYR